MQPPSLGQRRTFSMESAASGSGHSYPPTPPPALVVQPPSPSAVYAKLRAFAPAQPSRVRTHPAPDTEAPSTHFCLTPLCEAESARASLLARALSMFRTYSGSSSNSFSLCAVTPSAGRSDTVPALPAPTRTTGKAPPLLHLPSGSVLSSKPLLVFHDQTPFLTMHAVNGMIEIDHTAESMAGVHRSFWIAVALTYLGYLQEREGYLAALSD